MRSLLTSKPKIVFLDRVTIPSEISIPQLSFEHEWVNFATTNADELDQRLEAADIVISNKVMLDADTLARHPQIKLIAVSATGTNNVDLEYCRKHAIAVTNIQGYATQSVPEHALAMIFSLKRQLRAYQMDIERGKWQESGQFCFFSHPIQDVAGSTLGIIGSGSLGQAMANLARAVGMKVVFSERKGATQCRNGYLPFEEVIRTSDVISLHCPLSDETRHLISQGELSAMRSNAILINTGRGGLVDEQALIEALQQEQIAGAGSDVFTQEPADDCNPLIAHQTLPNLLLTPHIAWGSHSSITQLVDILVQNIEAFARGEQKNRVV
jgi:glycerate dehydrogenase